MSDIHFIFPHQLFKKLEFVSKQTTIYLIEENLFFKQYLFHKQKLVFHRASMKSYAQYLISLGYKVEYIESKNPLSDIRELINYLNRKKVEKITYAYVTDNWLEKRIKETCLLNSMQIEEYSSQLFINTVADIEEFFKDKKRYFQTDFYIHQRKKNKILVDKEDKPFEGKWSFDAENRLKYPKGKTPPKLKKIEVNSFYKEAIEYVEQNFSKNYGEIESAIIYPTNFEESELWLNDFLKIRLEDFGLFEDAIVKEEHFLHHSVLSPMLNVGLLLPMDVVKKAIDYALNNNIAYNSLEGFIRQIIGWREFIHAIYQREGTLERTKNYWGFERKIPASFYDGTTGIKPIDDAIKKVLKTGYNHHIERLMILSNFMLLCEFDPDDVYQWFMEMYIDSYDWVMVPNVYGMGQFADGGLMCRKPYISGSNYIFKMSDYKKGESWSEIWDALFWRFMNVHRSFFFSNPRLGMLVKTYDKMTTDKQQNLMKLADEFLLKLDA